MAKWEDGLGEWRGRELSLAHKQHFQAQEIALPPDMAPLRYLRVVCAKARGDGEGAGWKLCVSAVGPLRTINHSLLDGQREEGGRRNSLDSICPHLCYNGLINGSGSVSVFCCSTCSFHLSSRPLHHWGMESSFSLFRGGKGWVYAAIKLSIFLVTNTKH